MSGDHRDRDGIPPPTGPLEEPSGGEVVSLRPASRARRPTLPASDLAVSSFGEVTARVVAAGEPRWLIQGLWPADAYGVLAAQEKAGKTWAALDLAVSVATGRPWLDHFACPTRGPVVLDPLYLAAAGASGSSLYDMGAVLQAIQGVCQPAGCALLVVTHWNKTGDGRGADRISGADPADLGSPLSYAVEVLAAEDPEDLDPAAPALAKSRQWVLTALRAGGDMQTVMQLGTASPRPGIPSSLAPSRPPSASWKRPGWPPEARKATAAPATGHPPPPTTAPARERTRPDRSPRASCWHRPQGD